MTYATEADYKLIEGLKRSGVLRHMESSMIPDENGTIFISCTDGDRITNILRRHRRISLKGGPLLIPRDSPLASRETHEGPVILRRLLEENGRMKINTIVPFLEWPSNIALAAGLTLRQSLDIFALTEIRIRMFLQSYDLCPTVVPCLRLDHSDRPASYFFDKVRWDECKRGRPLAA